MTETMSILKAMQFIMINVDSFYLSVFDNRISIARTSQAYMQSGSKPM